MERAARNTEAAQLLETDVALSEGLEQRSLGTVLPLLTASGSSVRNQEEISIGNQVFVNLWDHSANVRLSVDLFRGTSIPNYIAARAGVDAAEQGARWQRAGLRLAAARAYLAALVSVANLDAAEEAVLLRQRSLEQTEVLFEGGYAVAADVSRARFSLIDAERAVVDTEQLLGDALDELAFLVMLPEVTTDDLVVPDLPTSVLAGDNLVDERADFRALAHELDSQEALTTGQWLTFLPTLSLAAQYNIGPESIRAPDGTYWFVTFSAVWNIFDFTRYGSVNVARASRDAAALELEEAERALPIELSVAERRIETAESRTELTEDAVEAAQQTRDLEAERYTAGDATVLELTTADVDLFNAQISHNLARLERALAIVEMAYLVGELEDDTWIAR